MKKNKLSILIFLALSSFKLDAMFWSFFPLMFMSSTIVQEDRANTILSRRWLNWLYAQNSSITTNKDISSNIDYYHHMIKNHYNRLLFKKQNNDQIKKAKLKKLVWSTGINACLWTSGFIFFKKALNNNNYNRKETYLMFSISSLTLGLFSLMFNCLLLDSYRKNDIALNRNLKRDEHMLDQFEKYKAGSVAQNN
jgi:hypothetical protein